MNKLLLTIALFSFSIHSFSKDIQGKKSIPKGTLSIGLQPVFRANKSTIGIGGNSTTASRLGLGLPGKYYIAKNFGIQAIIGFMRLTEKTDFGNGTSTTKTSGFDFSIGLDRPFILYSFFKGGAIFLTPQIKADVFTGKSNTTTPNATFKDDATGFQLGAFLAAEWFTKALDIPQLSLQAAIGLGGFTNSDIGGNETQNTWAFSPNNPQPGALNMLNATFGFHYYFF